MNVWMLAVSIAMNFEQKVLIPNKFADNNHQYDEMKTSDANNQHPNLKPDFVLQKKFIKKKTIELERKTNSNILF